MLAHERPGLFRAKIHLWDMAIETPSRDGAISEALRDPRAARKLLARTYATLEARYLSVSQNGSLPEHDISGIPEISIGYIYASLRRFFDYNYSLEEAFGLSRRGKKREWSDHAERWAASVPYKVIMIRRDHGEPEAVESAIFDGVEIIQRAVSEKSPNYANAASNISVARLWQLYSDWKERLRELEVRVERWASESLAAEEDGETKIVQKQ